MNANEAVLYEALRKRYPEDQYAVLAQIRNGTGFTARVRTADAIAMSLWPSRGLHLHGFEFKCDRRDWVKELAKPDKAEEIARYCHHWWVVTSREAIVKVEELPPLWGHLTLQEDGTLRLVKAAPLQEAEPLTIRFVASVLRSAQASSPSKAALNEARKAGFDAGTKTAEARRAAEREQHQRLSEAVLRFQQTTGLNLSDYRGPKRIGEAVNTVLRGGLEQHVSHLDHLAREADRIAAEARKAADAIRPHVPEEPE